MSKWPVVKLGDVIRQRNGFVQIDDFSEYKRCRVQLHAQGIVLRDTVSGGEIKTKKQQICRAGDFLVAEIDAKVGGFGIVPDDLDGAIVSSHYFLFEVNEQTLNGRFLDYFIRTPKFRDQVTAQGSTNYAAIRPNHVLGYEIPLPSLPEQRRIVARIEELASKINEAHGLRDMAAAEAESLGHFSLNSIAGTGVAARSLSEVCIQITDGEHATPPRVEEREIPLATAKNVRDGYLDMRFTDFVTRVTADYCWKRCKPSDGDVLMVCVGATTGRVCRLVLLPDMVIVRSVALLRPNGEILDSRFLEYALESRETQEQIWNSVKQAAQPCLYLNRIANLIIPVPSLFEQRRIVEELDAFQAQVTSLKKSQAETAAELDAMLPSILDKAFRGAL